MYFWCLQFSQKMNENNSTRGTIVVGELKIQKRHFKINWPLVFRSCTCKWRILCISWDLLTRILRNTLFPKRQGTRCMMFQYFTTEDMSSQCCQLAISWSGATSVGDHSYNHVSEGTGWWGQKKGIFCWHSLRFIPTVHVERVSLFYNRKK